MRDICLEPCLYLRHSFRTLRIPGTLFWTARLYLCSAKVCQFRQCTLPYALLAHISPRSTSER